MLLQVLLARLVSSTDEYGLYAAASALMFLAGSLLGFGAPIAVNKEIAAQGLSASDSRFLALQTWAQRIVFSAGFLLFAGSCVALLISWESSSSIDAQLLALCLAPLVAVLLFQQQIAQGLRALFWAFGPMNVIRPVAMLLLIALYWGFASQPISAVTAILLVGVSVTLAIYLQQRALGLSLWRRGPLPPQSVRVRLRKSALFFYVQRVSVASRDYTNTVLIGVFVGVDAAAMYFAAERLAKLALMPQQFHSWFVRPIIARSHAQNDSHRMQALVTRASYMSIFLALLIALALFLLGSFLLGLFGESYVSARNMMLLLLLAYLIEVFAGPVKDLLAMCGKEKALAWLAVGTLAAQLLSLLYLLPRYGTEGAVLSLIATATVSSFLGVFTVRILLGYRAGLFALLRIRAAV